MPRQDQESQKRLEPRRIFVALGWLNELGITDIEQTKTSLRFKFKGSMVTFYPYSGWHTGKSIKDGRGLKELLSQLK